MRDGNINLGGQISEHMLLVTMPRSPKCVQRVAKASSGIGDQMGQREVKVLDFNAAI